MRGATNRPGAAKPRIAISIHAPLAGCDTATLTWQRSYEQFQSTHPLRGATDAAGGPTAKTRRFQSTHPLRGATQVLRLTELLSLVFQSTHPLRGATTRSWNTALFMVNFNPRTPCGVRRHDVQQTVQVFLFQSTHPLRGATQDVQHTKDSNPFQSTHPLRGATTVGAQAVFTDGFQSTHPLRGATRPTRVMLPFVRRNFNPRTPGGVRRRLYNNPWAVFKFQSTHPLRGATAGSDARPGTVDISIHAPLAGCDSVDQRHGLGAAISIHAPLAGCDLLRISTTEATDAFQSTHPLRGATGCSPIGSLILIFQSTHPLRGATRRSESRRPLRQFQSTHPLRGATGERLIKGILAFISIHAPLAGCDVFAENLKKLRKISIHAPLAGCDSTISFGGKSGPYFNPRTPCGVRHIRRTLTDEQKVFQSTHPLRGATLPGLRQPPGHADFNPRTPCGVRLSPLFSSSVIFCISIHAPLAGCDRAFSMRSARSTISIHAPLAGCDV